MGAVSGLKGNVTYESGFTNIVNGWSATITADEQDITPLSPNGNHQVLLTAGLLQGASGSYRCKLPVSSVAALDDGGVYNVNPEAWMFEEKCEARDVTPLGADWKEFIAGLVTGRMDLTAYIDDETVLPLSGATATATLTCDAGGYSVPYVVLSVDAGVDVADTERRAVLHCGVAGAVTATTLPLAGTTGAATFTADSGAPEEYSGTILIVSVTARLNRRTSEGSLDIGWVAIGEFSN